MYRLGGGRPDSRVGVGTRVACCGSAKVEVREESKHELESVTFRRCREARDQSLSRRVESHCKRESLFVRCDFEMYRLVRGWAAVRVREWRGVVFSSRVCGAQWSAVVLVISVAYTGP